MDKQSLWSNEMIINRRNRLNACITYSPGQATIKECQSMTPRQIIVAYRDLRNLNSNASVFVTLYRNGQRLAWNSNELIQLTDKYVDEIELTVMA